MPFSRRIGLRMSAWSTSVMAIGRRSAAIRPAKPRPTGMRTPCSTSSSMPLAARACSVVALQQQERHRVDLQDLGDPVHQLLQEVLLGEEGERGVCDPLQRVEDLAVAAHAQQRWVDGPPRHRGDVRRVGHVKVTKTARGGVTLAGMRKASIVGPVALGAAAGLLAAAVGDVTMAAAAGVVGLTVLGTGRD